MQIIIPMTGYGSRFVAAGYNDLKPFIKVENKPILEWILHMYKNEEIIFVCRKEHLDTISGMRELLKRLSPNATIFEIEDFIKKGPVYSVLQAESVIDDNKPSIINYCDFYMTWDYEAFKKDVLSNECDGAVPCYTGFHPHLLIEKNVYASCKTDENRYLIEIREKYGFDKDRFKTLWSPGAYYFKTGAILKKYCKKLVESNDNINGEFYASLPYNFMVKDGLKVWVPTKHIKYFMQWGTPRDMEESVYYLDMMKRGDIR